MNPFKPESRGHLSGDDLDTLVRWGLRSSVEGAQPSDAAWERIKLAAAAQRREQKRRPIPMQRINAVRRSIDLNALPLVGYVNSLVSLLRFISTRVEAYDLQWPEDNRPRWAFTPGLLWIMLATDQRIY